ncbi:MAG: hypothetical protein BWY56_02107 [Acidobacteria bacterium ADurb.Bin340]|nr:MAG: hypothetical protein BWY56_02107 [Acidobacteria bacterium ADurb.Bin340]
MLHGHAQVAGHGGRGVTREDTVLREAFPQVDEIRMQHAAEVAVPVEGVGEALREAPGSREHASAEHHLAGHPHARHHQHRELALGRHEAALVVEEGGAVQRTPLRIDLLPFADHQARTPVGLQHPDAARREVRHQGIIRGEEDQILPPRELEGAVEVPNHPEIAWVDVHLDAFPVSLGPFDRCIRGGVVHEDNLQLRIALGQDRAEARIDVARVVVVRNAHAHEGRRHRSSCAKGMEARYRAYQTWVRRSPSSTDSSGAHPKRSRKRRSSPT